MKIASITEKPRAVWYSRFARYCFIENALEIGRKRGKNLGTLAEYSRN
jgi:hypothetical protein